MNFHVSVRNSCSGETKNATFIILQGSVATYLMCGGKRDKGFIANFLLSPTMKEFLKSVNNYLPKLLTNNIIDLFYDSQCIIQRWLQVCDEL